MSTQTPVSDLVVLAVAPASNDTVPILDVSDTTQSADGSLKQIAITTLFTSVTITTSLTVTGTLAVSGNVAVATNKFTVAAATGNTVVAGVLDVTGSLGINGTKLTVSSTNGNLVSEGSLTATNLVTSGTTGVQGQFTQTGASSIGIQIRRTGGTTSDWQVYTPSSQTYLALFASSADKFTFTTAGTLTAVGGFASQSPSVGIGYVAGAGGAVTQATDKSTAVTLNTVTGAITMNNATLNNGAKVTFTVNNSRVQTGDTVIAIHASGGTSSAYEVRVSNIVNATSFAVTVINDSGGNLGEAIVINFAIIRGAAA